MLKRILSNTVHRRFYRKERESMQEQTIAAISTPLGAGGLGVVRVSGKEAFSVADRVFKAKRGVPLSEMKPYTAAYGQVFSEGKLLDECIALTFRAPKSYTGEDVVELSCHGGVQVMRRLLEATLQAGARLAQPGEFTKRAFLNGRIDLTQAESVMEMITAKSTQAVTAAAAQENGALSRRMRSIRDALYDISADITAFVDFPEEDIPDLSAPVLLKTLHNIQEQLSAVIGGYEKGRILRDGLSAVIAGRPNVGKSTLMNRMAGYEKSIVTEYAGTTRDVVEESVQFGGCVLNLMDTAGLRETDNPVESIGVRRAKARIEQADLVFAVFDSSSALEEEDRLLLQSLAGRRAIAVLNKGDLPCKIDKKYIQKYIQHIVTISAAVGEGMEQLEATVCRFSETDTLDPAAGILTNIRQLSCAQAAKEAVEAAITAVADGVTLDAVSTCIEQAVLEIGKLTGEYATEEIIGRVFEKFCVGK